MVRLSRSFPLVLAVVLLWVCLAVLLVESLRRTGGHLVYALDDPYIHMAMAKNMARHGVWGVSPNEFSASSSSLLWTGTLSGFFFAFGVLEWLPFALNWLLATVAVAVTFGYFRDCAPQAPLSYVTGVLLVSAFSTPLPALVFAGQEHVAHVILNLTFLVVGARTLTGAVLPEGWKSYRPLIILAPLLTLVRYEGLFAVGLMAALLFVRRRFLAAAAVAVAGALPVVAYGIAAVGMGWFFLPSSVLLKASRPDLGTTEGFLRTLGWGVGTLWRIPAVAALVGVALILFALSWRRTFTQVSTLLLALFLALTLAHMQFSQPRSFWLYRYEAYLVSLGVFAVALALIDFLPLDFRRHHKAVVALAYGSLILAFLASPLAIRALGGVRRIPRATANIYEQSYQVGRFVRSYYSGSSVALSDIGAVTFLADVHCLDLIGLASLDVATRRLHGDFFQDDIEDAARSRGTRIAIVHDYRFQGARSLPRGWLRAGTWTIRDRVVVAAATVSFYATTAEELPALTRHLREFAAELPDRVSYAVD